MKIHTRRNKGLEVSKEKENTIDKLEKAILKYQESLWDGFVCVDDNTYNACIEYLEILNPWSDILRNERKIKTFYSLNDKFKEALWGIIGEEAEDIYFLLNPQGLNVKLYYTSGKLIKAETYGRTLGTIDVTESVKKLIGNKNDMIDKEGNIVLIGTIVLPLVNMDAAKELCNAQDTYTGVFSVIKALESLTDTDGHIDDYTDILMFVCTDVEIEGLPNISIESKINYIKGYGIETAPILKLQREGADIATIEDALYTFETLYGDIDYKTDGIRILPTNTEDTTIYLIRVKKWGRAAIASSIEEIEWVNTKDGYKPLLKLDREIELYDRNIITELKMDKILYLLFLGLGVGSIIRFIYSIDIGYILLDNDNEIIIL